MKNPFLIFFAMMLFIACNNDEPVAKDLPAKIEQERIDDRLGLVAKLDGLRRQLEAEFEAIG